MSIARNGNWGNWWSAAAIFDAYVFHACGHTMRTLTEHENQRVAESCTDRCGNIRCRGCYEIIENDELASLYATCRS